MTKLYTKSNCCLCQIVKEYFDSINIKYESINIDTRIPADLIEQMNKPEFPENFNYPIVIHNNKIYFGENCLNLY
jgi:glutaredoxin